MKPPRPNILLITTDQQRWDHLGLLGTPGIRTPHLDQLAADGTHFGRAYTPSPLCIPCRVSLLTGQYPSSHHAYSIGMTVDPFPAPTLPTLLAAAGYHTKLVGKSHFVARPHEARHMAGGEPPPGFFRDWHGPYVGFQEVSASTGHTMNNEPDMHYRVFLEDAGVDFRPWFRSGRKDYDHHWAGAWDIPAPYHDTAWVGGVTEEYITRRAGSGKPWFCWASFQDPHEPFVCPEPWYSQVQADALRPYEGYRDGEFADRPGIYQRMLTRDFGTYSEGNGVPCSYGNPDRDPLRSLQATAGMLAFIDDQVGRIRQRLAATGQAENTIIIFTSDHGELHGHHGLWGKGLAAYEDCQRIPLIVAGPGRLPAQGTTAALANLVDLPRTCLGFAGLRIPQGMQGRDLGPVLHQAQARVQDAVLIESRVTRQTLYQQTLVTERHKLVVYRDWEEGELYDLEHDPDQYANLWSRPEHRDLRERLLMRLARLHMERDGEVHPRISFG
ncbi:MAG: sulfatase-like hydrolase/transferase [Gemmataceae bacterium]|nr:sulfatase-like hydrolase/transferase [Gemmataceae bacterium]